MNDSLFGFKLQEKRFIKEVNSDCLYFLHEKSGARLVKIASDDANKTFCIAFKTLPDSDNGAPHILEHSVLNGSTGFPVKSPFDVLLKGSLHTFLNAMTGKDITMYPVASMNEKDYFNLVHVYLDAVFNPMIYHDDRILKQEGWHHELENIDGSLVYKGVVYNEMKGSFSNPVRELWYQVFKHLFPDNVYGIESGGYPSIIPTLTNEQFLDFHRKFYHPENSYIYLYGNAPLEKELEFINNHYLSKYEKTGAEIIIKDQVGFDSMKDINGFYPVSEGDLIEDQTFLSMTWVVGNGADKALTMALDLLCELLVNQESAPLRLALQSHKIGQDVSASCSVYQQNVVQITVRNANPEQKQQFYEIVKKTFEEVFATGLDKKELEGVLNRMEFYLREGNDAQKGMTYIEQSYPGFFYQGDPFSGLQYETFLEEVQGALTSDYLEKLIQKCFLENNHSLLFSLSPKPGLDQEINKATEKELENFKKGLTEEEITGLAKQTEELIEYQQREESPEALATIPMLDITDIEPEVRWYPFSELKVENVPFVFHEEFTNDVVYAQFYFDLRVLPLELLPYASLLSNIIGLLDTKKHSFAELNQLLNIHTGGFYTSLNAFLEEHNDEKTLPKFVVTSKAMKSKVSMLFELVEEVLFSTKYIDTERIKSLLTRHQSQLDASIKRAGNRFSSIRLSSYHSNQGMFRELTEGLEYYWFVKELVREYDRKADIIINNLCQVSDLLFTKKNLVVAATSDSLESSPFSRQLESFLKGVPEMERVLHHWKFNPGFKKEGIATASQVQYVMQGYNFKKLGFEWNAKMRVLNQVLSTDWLQTQIRVVGGAYGGYSTVMPSGLITLNSYRDPNLRETLANFKGTPEYLEKFDADDTTMTRFIIGTISSMDHPLTPSQKGDLAISHYFTKRTKEKMQIDRNSVLQTTAKDVREFAGLIASVLEQENFCVLGNEEKIRQEKDLFDTVIKLDK